MLLVLLALVSCERRQRQPSPTEKADASPTQAGAGFCSRVASEDGKRRYRDALGRAVEVPEHPERIVSLAPNLTEALFAVGAGDGVVGVTKFCDYPEQVKSLPNVGGFTDTSPEAVIGLHPDLILATADTSTRRRFDAIEATGQRAFVFLPDDLDSIREMISCVGLLTGHTDRAAEVVAGMREAEQRVHERVAAASERPRTLVLLQAEPLIAAGSDTFLDRLIVAAGGENIAADAPVSWPRLSREWVLTRKPQVVLVTFPAGVDRAEELLEGTPAAADGRIHAVDPALIERPGPRIVEGLERVAGYLHPDEKP